MTNLETTNDPHDVGRALNALADRYRADQANLQSAWQDTQAGRVWGELAKILDRAALQAERACERYFK